MSRQIITTDDELLDLLPTWRGHSFAFDTETTGLDVRKDRLLGLALYFDDGRAYYIVLEHNVEEDGQVHLKTFIDRAIMAYHAFSLFSQQDVIMVAHNSKFDLHFLHRLGIYVEGKLFDTLLAAQLLDETRKNGLKELAHLVGMQYDKYATLVKYEGYSKDEILGAALPDVAEYAMNDVEATWKLYDKFRYELAEEGLEPVFVNIWMPLVITLQQMEAKGIALDLDAVHELKKEYEELRSQAEEKINSRGLSILLERYAIADIPDRYLRMAREEELEYAFTDSKGRHVTRVGTASVPVITYEDRGKSKTWRPRVPEFSVGSNDDIHDLLFEWSGIEVDPDWRLQTNTKGYKVDKDNIEMLSYFLQDDKPDYLDDILTYRKTEKFIGTYLENFIKLADPDDYNSVTTSFNQSTTERGKSGGTRTGRLSSSDPINLQNIPAHGEVGQRARNCFIARPGHKLVVADYSAMEMVLWAHFSKDPLLIESISSGLDMHAMTAAGQHNIPYDEFMERYHNGDQEVKEWRAIGKTSNFGALYGIGAKKFQRFLLVKNGVLVPLDESQRLLTAIDETYPEGYAWKQQVWRFVGKHGYVLTMARRKRRLPQAIDGLFWQKREAERQAVNTCIQGSCGDIICEAMPPIQKMLQGLGGTLLLQVHDELVAEVPEQNAELAAELMPRMMVGFVNPRLRCKLSAEVGIGNTWAEAKN